jgi:hypothetical protein
LVVLLVFRGIVMFWPLVLILHHFWLGFAKSFKIDYSPLHLLGLLVPTSVAFYLHCACALLSVLKLGCLSSGATLESSGAWFSS